MACTDTLSHTPTPKVGSTATRAASRPSQPGSASRRLPAGCAVYRYDAAALGYRELRRIHPGPRVFSAWWGKLINSCADRSARILHVEDHSVTQVSVDDLPGDSHAAIWPILEQFLEL